MYTIAIYGFIICIIMAIIHLMYQFVILPSLKQSLRFKFHKLNDEVISMVIDDKASIPPLEFNFTMHIIGTGIKNLSHYNLASIFTISNISKKEDEVINSKIEELEKQMHNERLKQIHQECLNIAFKAFIYNTAMLLIYLLPIFLVLYLFSKMFGYSKNIKNFYLSWINNRIESNFTPINAQRQYCYF